MKYVLMALCLCSTLSADRIYIDQSDLDISDQSFYIHQGENIWLETGTVYNDETGIYILESKLKKSNNEFEKKWKCPYCHRMWPLKTPCQNPDCPSKYSKVKLK